jgi:hypothetical protein
VTIRELIIHLQELPEEEHDKVIYCDSDYGPGPVKGACVTEGYNTEPYWYLESQ